MLDAYLVPEKSKINAKGDGDAVDISAASNRVFLLVLNISEVVEQESLDVSIFGSTDGITWEPKPLLSFPQKFYTSEMPLLLNLIGCPEVKFLRAHWEPNRWGRGPEEPMFVADVRLREVPEGMTEERTRR